METLQTEQISLRQELNSYRDTVQTQSRKIKQLEQEKAALEAMSKDRSAQLHQLQELRKQRHQVKQEEENKHQQVQLVQQQAIGDTKCTLPEHGLGQGHRAIALPHNAMHAHTHPHSHSHSHSPHKQGNKKGKPTVFDRLSSPANFTGVQKRKSLLLSQGVSNTIDNLATNTILNRCSLNVCTGLSRPAAGAFLER